MMSVARKEEVGYLPCERAFFVMPSVLHGFSPRFFTPCSFDVTMAKLRVRFESRQLWMKGCFRDAVYWVYSYYAVNLKWDATVKTLHKNTKGRTKG